MSRGAFLRDVGLREYVDAIYLQRWAEWLRRPFLCKVGHHVEKEDGWWNGDAQAWEERWIVCSRCGLWMGHTEYHGRPVPR